ncbi:adenylate cyclase [Dispira parvispora]|uniref:N-acyl-aliphatic-L-amino acid amidohydrolase n=1 Tax=Dispira parvispora TaxID=1520584 RepID=A0A9W8AQA9_9FUNG|nr:adenylate cyclase [Dispira parvispora]
MATEFPASVRNFQRYLQIKTMQPNPDYVSCVEFLLAQGDELGLQGKVHTLVPGKPIVVLTWPGRNPDLPTVALNSHTDVVPVYEEFWDHDPFAATIVPDSGSGEHRIVARGAQDMKIVGMCYLEAIRELQRTGVTQLERTVHLLFVPDEETGSEDGMKKFVHHEAFHALRIGVFLDEGISNPEDAYKVFYAERAPWWVRYTAHGNTGHGSQFINHTAIPKLLNVVNTLLDFRAKEEQRLLHDVKEDGQSRLRLGDVTTVNLTMLNCGKQVNVVPECAEASFDIRVCPTVDLVQFEAWLHKLADTNDVQLDIIQSYKGKNLTPLENNPWWECIQAASKEAGIALDTDIFPAATDSRFVRPLGIPAFGISPLRNTPILLHDHNEYVTVRSYLEGIQFYQKVISALGSMK